MYAIIILQIDGVVGRFCEVFPYFSSKPSIGKLFGRVPEKSPISVRIEKWLNPGEYREKLEFVRVSKNSSDEYRKRVQSVCVPKNCRIRVRNGKR